MNKILKISLASILIITALHYKLEAEPIKLINEHPSDNIPKLPDYLPNNENKSGQEIKDFILPPITKIKKTPQSQPLFILKDVVFEGNTVFSNQKLDKIATPFLNQKVSLTDLEELRFRLTKLYVDQGYPNSGAIIKPDQKINNGTIIYKITEGHLDDINITGNENLRANYIGKRVWPDPQVPFNINLLQDRFRMLLQNPLIDRMNGRIIPGTKPGEAILDLNVKRAKPYNLDIGLDNYSSPSQGAERVIFNGTVRNITGFGDTLNMIYGHSEGTDSFNGSFAVPVNYQNTVLTLGFSHNDNAVIEEPMKDIDVTSSLNNFTLSLNHPVYNTLERKIDLGITFQNKTSKTHLLGEPFSFSEGYSNGVCKINVLRLIQLFQDSGTNHAFIFRSTFNFGLDVFNSTIHEDGHFDSDFITWIGQCQYAYRISEKFGQIISKGSIQIANDNLPSMERFSIGGVSTVRGYRENEMVRDNGFVLSSEWRVPLWKQEGTKDKYRMIQIAPFIDYGAGWNKGESFNDDRLFSIGLGLLWTSQRIDAQLYYAHGFEDVSSKPEYNLQDDGIHFNITIKLL